LLLVVLIGLASAMKGNMDIIANLEVLSDEIVSHVNAA
jgi:hypothetical protein